MSKGRAILLQKRALIGRLSFKKGVGGSILARDLDSDPTSSSKGTGATKQSFTSDQRVQRSRIPSIKNLKCSAVNYI